MSLENQSCGNLHTREELMQVLSYDPETGIFRWKVSWKHMREGKEITNTCVAGYGRVKFQGKAYKLHRLAWLFHHGEWPKGHIDHINRVKNDNRIVNLRDVSPARNMRNQGMYSTNKSGAKGVYWFHGKWVAYQKLNYKVHYLGRFDTVEEASKVVNKFRLENDFDLT